MNKQRLLSLLLALVMVLGAFGVASASEVNKSDANDAKIQWLVDNEIVVGRKVNENKEDNDLALDEDLTRAEVTKLIVYTLGKQDLADTLDGVIKPFPDVDNSHWANGYISVAATQRTNKDNDNGIIIGYEDGEFKPERDVTYAELATMLVRIVKDDLTKEMEDKAIWATDYLRWAEEEGILDGIKVLDSNAAIDRYDAFVMIYNAFFELGETGVNQAKFGDQLGIVSRIGSGQVEINQDKVYKLNWNSYLSRGTGWEELSKNLNRDEVGSLVRFTTNEDGEITHLIVLGNDGVAAPNSRWKGVADEAVPQGDDAPSTATFSGQYFDTINVGGITAEIDDDTRFFVADVSNNALKEVEDLATVFKLYVNQDKEYNKVYMGYDTYAGRNEAKVIVFGDVDKYQGVNDVRRVTQFLNSKEDFEAEDTKGVRTKYNIKKTTGFPAADYVDVNDVVRVREGHWDSDPVEVLIDYKDFNVYEIVDISENDRVVKLKDEFDNQGEFYIKDAKIFRENQFEKGKNVQIAFDDSGDKDQKAEADREIKYISVVDKDLKGELKDGTFVGNTKGYLKEVKSATADNPSIAKGYPYMARFAATEGGSGVKDYYVTSLDATILDLAIDENVHIGKEFTFDVRNEDGLKVASKFQFTQDQWNKIAENAIAEYEKTGNTIFKEAAQEAIENLKASEDNRATRQSELDAVKPNLTSIDLTGTDNMKIDETQTLTVTPTPANAEYTVESFTSNKPDVADVDDNGLVKAKTPGNATITVTAKTRNNTSFTRTFTVTVQNNNTELESVTIKKSASDADDVITVKAEKFDDAIEFVGSPPAKTATIALSSEDNVDGLLLKNFTITPKAEVGSTVTNQEYDADSKTLTFTIQAEDGTAEQNYKLVVEKTQE